MRVVVCVRQGLDGELCPFDACAYEAALRIEGAEVILLSMGALSSKEFLHSLTRLGASRAILLSDKAFAGADTLATAYALSLAIKKLSPELVLCGRQTSVGDTAQTGAMLSELCGYSLITNAMSIEPSADGRVVCDTRSEGRTEVALPALLTVERINTLRLPRLRSRLGAIEIWSAEDIGADIEKCGLSGSPTRVVKTFENSAGRRKCKFISMSKLQTVIEEGLQKSRNAVAPAKESGEKLSCVCIVGEAPRSFAETVSDNIVTLPLDDADSICKAIQSIDPDAVIWGSDTRSKRLSAIVAARMSLGLCADCTLLDCEGGELMMYRPALSGSVIAKIKSLTRPAMATVRTESGSCADIIVTAGYGARSSMDKVRQLAEKLGAELCATRKMVDNGYAPYSAQVGLTGKTVSPAVYIAIGVSGAVHHIVGMQRSGTVIAIAPDREAPIFDYADYGILENF